ncbi:MAG: aldo/keto reductase [Acidimicrobiales bacterium]
MEHTRLGRTGLVVSRICLGTMTFGFQCDEETSLAILDKSADMGVTFIDTADAYPLGGPRESLGRTEEIVGKWLNGRRDDYVLATKCFFPTGRRRFQGGASRRHIMSAVESSLKRLGTDFIDLYQLHSWDPNTPIDETLGALDDLVRSGKVRYVGCSNYLAYQLARSVGRSEALGLARMDSAQPRYNLLFREIERELLALCDEEGIGVIAYNPIAGGMLSGKHKAGSAPTEGTRFTLGSAAERYTDRYWHNQEFATVEALRPLAADAGLSMPRMATAWVLANPAVTSAIVGASRPEQMDETVGAIDTVLDSDLKARLDDLTTDYRRGDAGR